MKRLTWYLKNAVNLGALVLAIVPESATARFNSVDPLQQKYPAWSPYVYALSNPVRNLDANGAEVFSVTVDVYIPYKSVLGFRGDNRGPSSDPNRTYRVQQTVQVETDPTISSNPITNSTAKAGVTVLDIPGLASGVGQAGTEGITASGIRTSDNGGDNVMVALSGSVSNPFIPKVLRGSIDYSFQISVTPGQSPTVKGSHDGFPAYTVTVKDKDGNSIGGYQYTPRGWWQFGSLLPPKEKSVTDKDGAPGADHKDFPGTTPDWVIDPRHHSEPPR